MTIQQACDSLTELCHQGLAQARLMYINETLVKEVGGFEKMDGETVLVRSQIKWPEPYKPECYEAELNCECRICVYTDSPCVLSDYEKDKNGICDHFKNVFEENAELKEKLALRKFAD